VGPLLHRLLNKKKRKQPQTLRFFLVAQSSTSHLLHKMNGKRQVGRVHLWRLIPEPMQVVLESTLPRRSSPWHHPLYLDAHHFSLICSAFSSASSGSTTPPRCSSTSSMTMMRRAGHRWWPSGQSRWAVRVEEGDSVQSGWRKGTRCSQSREGEVDWDASEKKINHSAKQLA
jgi:hypothetical protein